MTTAAEQYPDRGGDPLEEEFGGRLSHKLLLDNVRQLANNRQGFRTGLIDEVQARVGTSDIAEDAIMLEPENGEDREFREIHATSIESAYEFRAMRFKAVDQPSFTEFTFAAVVSHNGVELPAHIAVEYLADMSIDEDEDEDDEGGLDLDPDDDSTSRERAIDMGRKMFWVLKQRMEFTIATNNRVVAMHESRTYLDEEDTIVVASCSCSDPDCDYRTDLLDEDEHEVVEGFAERAGQGSADSTRDYTQVATRFGTVFALRPAHESLRDDDPDNNLKFWEMHAKWSDLKTLFPSRKEIADQEDQQLRQAFKVLSLLKAALREQAGVA